MTNSIHIWCDLWDFNPGFRILANLSLSFVFQGEAAEEAKNAGANIVGGEELIKEVICIDYGANVLIS